MGRTLEFPGQLANGAAIYLLAEEMVLVSLNSYFANTILEIARKLSYRSYSGALVVRQIH